MSDELKMSLKSMDIAEEKKAQLKQLFPEVFTESKIDFDRLRQVLGEHIETGKERYGMTWAGKSNCFKIIQDSSVGTLKPCREESVNFDTTENLFIEGDNLEVLKLLQKSYYGKVKMIYIDPPYNTGNEFIYPDNFSESLDTYLKYTGQKDAEGKKFSTNVESDGRFHSKWMNMMYPRLYLARNLLDVNGTIFISIDDNEVSNLIKICDEIFGSESFVAIFPWRSRTAKADVPFGVSVDVEWIVCYAKENFLAGRSGERKYYKSEDIEDRWRLSDLTTNKSKQERPNSFFDLVNPKNKERFSSSETRTWSVTKDTFQDYYNRGKIVFPGDYDFLKIKTPVFRVFESEDRKKAHEKYGSEDIKMAISSYLIEKDVGRTEHGTKEIRELFDEPIFPYPKPSSLIKFFVQNCSSKNDIIVDFFSGSATTAHSIFEMNLEDCQNRKFILVQLPEPTKPESEACRAGYKTIAEVGKERIRRVIMKLNLIQSDSVRNLGFKVFKLSVSNFKIWETEYDQDVYRNLNIFSDHIILNSKPDDILYEILLKSGFELTTKIEKIKVEGKEVFSIEDGAMFIYLGDGITKEITYAIAEKSPGRFVCLDHSFHHNDQLKTNTVQLMKSRNIEFRTV